MKELVYANVLYEHTPPSPTILQKSVVAYIANKSLWYISIFLFHNTDTYEYEILDEVVILKVSLYRKPFLRMVKI